MPDSGTLEEWSPRSGSWCRCMTPRGCITTSVSRRGGVLRSWAVPKGPSLDPRVRRLAVPVEDHEMSAGDFEGVHVGQIRGTGAVIVWDEGTAEIVRDEPEHLSFVLHGRKLSGGFGLTRTGEKRWILVKVRDEDAQPGSDIVAEQPASVRSGRTWQEVAAQSIG